jgi:hypothetical protein
MGGIVPVYDLLPRHAAPSRFCMRPRPLSTVLLILAALAADSNAFGAEGDVFAVSLGGTKIVLPIPPHYADPAAAQSLIDQQAQAVPAGVHILGMLVRRDEIDRLAKHEDLSCYYILQAARAFEQAGIDATLFEQLKASLHTHGAEVARRHDAIENASAERLSERIRKDSGDTTTKLEIRDSAALVVFDERPNSISASNVGPVSLTSDGSTRQKNVVQASAIMRIHAKQLSVALSCQYGSPRDRSDTERQIRDYVDRVEMLNPEPAAP